MRHHKMIQAIYRNKKIISLLIACLCAIQIVSKIRSGFLTPYLTFTHNSDPYAQYDFSTTIAWLNRSDDDHEFYLMSAIWDDRWSEFDDPAISIFFFAHAAYPDTFVFVQCAKPAATSPQVYTLVLTKTDVNEMNLLHKTYGPRRYIRGILKARAERCERPVRVSVGWSEGSIAHMDDTNSVPVEYPPREQVDNFTICIPPIFGCLNPYSVIEWMEIQKLLGVTKVVIHNTTQCEETSKVLIEYGKQGLVEIRQDRVLLATEGEIYGFNMARNELRIRTAAMLSECLTRHMYSTKWIFFADLDELYLPEKERTLDELMGNLRNNIYANVSYVGQFTFSNILFLVDDGDPVTRHMVKQPTDRTYPKTTHFLQHRMHLPPSLNNKRNKIIMDPFSCKFLNNHHCQVSINEYKLGVPEFDTIDVPPHIAWIQHYRTSPCRFIGPAKDNNITCRGDVPSSPITEDKKILRYSEELMENVNAQLTLMGLA